LKTDDIDSTRQSSYSVDIAHQTLDALDFEGSLRDEVFEVLVSSIELSEALLDFLLSVLPSKAVTFGGNPILLLLGVVRFSSAATNTARSSRAALVLAVRAELVVVRTASRGLLGILVGAANRLGELFGCELDFMMLFLRTEYPSPIKAGGQSGKC